MIERLLENISRIVSLTLPEKERLYSFWTTKTLPKNTYLFRTGEICTHDSYVASGLLKAFYINQESGREEILFFAAEDWWATDLASFANQQPSLYAIQALETTTLLQINSRQFEEMLGEIPKLERYFRIILQQYTASLQHRIVRNLSYSAEERYIDFYQRYPDLAQRVPQYLIASYLGVTPEFFSKLRSQNR